MTTYAQAKARHDALVERYNREYREGRWTTNRELAAQCEDAYDRMIAARDGDAGARPCCDYCDGFEDETPALTWNGDTGCHVECERKAGE